MPSLHMLENAIRNIKKEMLKVTIRDERLKQLVAACVKKGKNPNIRKDSPLLGGPKAEVGRRRRVKLVPLVNIVWAESVLEVS